MKLLSTLKRFKSGTNSGNYSGDLHLFFTMTNHADWKMAGQAFFWIAGEGANDTYDQPPVQDKITLALEVNTADLGAPGTVFIFGTMSITTKNNVTFNSTAFGQGNGIFVPGTARTAAVSGKTGGTVSGVQFDLSFDLNVPWDGVSADCHGTWSAVWK